MEISHFTTIFPLFLPAPVLFVFGLFLLLLCVRSKPRYHHRIGSSKNSNSFIKIRQVSRTLKITPASGKSSLSG